MHLSLVAAMLLAAESASLPDWLAGSWTTPATSGEWSEEWWTPPKAGIMLGASRSGKAEALRFFEHMRIVATAEGIAFCAMPQGKAGACFKAVAAGERSITFENAQNDYPGRITYRREGEELVAEISTLKGDRLQRWRFRRLGN